MNKDKCLEYYLDSRIYNLEEVQKNIEKTKQEFPKKEIKVNISMNQYGMYIITFYFENKKMKKTKKRLEKYYGNNYGKYKTTQIHKPY